MQFRLIPILNQIEQLYQAPKNRARFEEYLYLLQGNSKEDLILPIAGYNPMAGKKALHKLKALQDVQAENIAQDCIDRINEEVKDLAAIEFKLVLNLVDDVGGAWSNFYVTDYKNKFEADALTKRRFCTPLFWTSENYTTNLILKRIEAAIFRTIYNFKYGKLTSLQSLLEQEIYVQQSIKTNQTEIDKNEFQKGTQIN